MPEANDEVTSDVQIVNVTASGSEAANPPSNAIDGSLTTRWSNLGVGSWLQADLGSTQSISSVSIAWYLGDQRANHFQVGTSSDGATFAQVVDATSSGTNANLETYTFT